ARDCARGNAQESDEVEKWILAHRARGRRADPAGVFPLSGENRRLRTAVPSRRRPRRRHCAPARVLPAVHGQEPRHDLTWRDQQQRSPRRHEGCEGKATKWNREKLESNACESFSLSTLATASARASPSVHSFRALPSCPSCLRGGPLFPWPGAASQRSECPD